MKWSEKLVDGQLVGYESAFENAYFFFGTKFSPRERLPSLFPEFTFSFLKQVHGANVVDADPAKIFDADAQWTTKKNLALVIQTADCLPILLGNSSHALAVHAGWRGLEQNIITLGVKKLPVATAPLAAAIGPHIQKQSFEVGRDVALKLESCIPGGERAILPHADKTKNYINLSLLAQLQLQNSQAQLAELHALNYNTFDSELFHSFRRGKQTPDRQYSFVVIRD